MKRSLYYRNFAAMASIVFLSFVLLGAAFSATTRALLMNERRSSMANTAGEVVRSASSMSSDWRLDSLEMKLIMSMNSSASGYQIMLADTGGRVVCCSDRDMHCGHLGMTVDRGVIESLNKTGEFNGTGRIGIFSEKKYIVARLMADDYSGSILGYALLSSEPSSMAKSWRQASGVFVYVAIVVLAIASAVSLITSKKQTEPLNEMAQAADKFARGEFDVRVSDEGREDEIGRLTNAFNAMAEALQLSESKRREFIANISHELKTPMTTISGFADGILDGTIPKEEQGRYLASISSETKRLSRLVRSMLDMSQLQSVEKATIMGGRFDIVEVVAQTLLGLEGRITSRGLDVEAELPEEPVIVRGDMDSITRVVYNLVDNAAKFAGEGTALKISVWKQGQRAYVAIEDHGAEIPPDELPLIFDRFHKADHSRSQDKDGVGLGLYIVKSILDNHGEDIFVTSENGSTKFVFTLTVCDELLSNKNN